ncbi:type I methionyl aminopeptidase [Paraflavitalea speifideaquila]|uniref:type I methionyl aminopeptidase n=1 Tax=Paraflavitalea speifideaquila TaxID=3076558 RepID=UPI0028EA3DCF|nr:M24 family metallopeptidase [Paraflavitalea speifideiaquila]
MVYIKSPAEVELMRHSALLVSATLAEIAKLLRPGITTLSLDKTIGEMIHDHGGVPSFLNFHGYPYNSCISVNDVVVHGFPNNAELKDGDIISVDIGIVKNGFHGDHAYTFAIGDVKPEVLQLIRVTKESLYKGIEKATAGNRIGDIGAAIQEHTEKNMVMV